jgi:DegV family protein with EDD domain
MGVKVGVIADSAIDLPKGIAKKKNIHLIPCSVVINEKPKRHGIDIINQEVVEHLMQKDDVRTEPPTPLAYSTAYKRISEEYDIIYSMNVGSDLSKCYENAQRGIKLLKTKKRAEERGFFFKNNIKLIDTKASSIAQGQITNRVASILKKQAYNGAKLDKYIAWLIKNVSVFFVVDDLYWLMKSGKLNPFSKFIGKMFDVKPVLKLEKGNLVPADKQRGKDTAIDSMIRMAEEIIPKYKRGVEIWVAHSSALLDAKHIRQQLAMSAKIDKKKIPIVEIGATITAHAGPGVVSVSVLPK